MKVLFRQWMLGCICLFVSGSLYANPAEVKAFANDLETVMLPGPGVMLANPRIEGFRTYGPHLRSEYIDAQTVPGKRCLRTAISKKTKNAFDQGLTFPVPSPISKGDLILMAVWMTRLDANDDGPAVDITLPMSLQLQKSPYTSVVQKGLGVPQNWRVVYAKGIATDSILPGEANVAFQLGEHAANYCFGPVYVYRMAPSVSLESLPGN